MMGLPGLQVSKPWYSEHKEILLCPFFGDLTVFLNLTPFILSMKRFDWGALFTNVVDWVICVLFQFIMNKTQVFGAETDSAKSFWAQLTDFFNGRLLTFDVGEPMLFVFIDRLRWDSLLVKPIVQIVVVASNYVISKLFMFKEKG